MAHEQSFSRAAEKLSLSQPSVSHQIALLETEIGVRVFDRDRGRAGLRLTHVGEVLLELRPRWRGFVPAAIRRLRSADGGLRIILSEVTPSTLESRFISGEFDVASASAGSRAS
ncbi:LysR family transcriptional regulator [Solirubrobacter ginsenosidimutans]|uniref:LysR family transcriptional regulator n=1 Tax=Solirubrobacter ginsenosidimutans TaxID=490573 RepID=A0A9X3RZ09_9ACTN|nr:LysR family transcriptional regulator [Solirubrobacter ginsenosidimutans]MDA0160395.1 LysR family transcriptional regulator [Solirubrobacter ginsenosidimutans]